MYGTYDYVLLTMYIDNLTHKTLAPSPPPTGSGNPVENHMFSTFSSVECTVECLFSTEYSGNAESARIPFF